MKGTFKICHRIGRSSHNFFWKSRSKLEKQTLSKNNLHFFGKNILMLKLVKRVLFEMDIENKSQKQQIFL